MTWGIDDCMRNNLRIISRHGVDVVENQSTDELRRSECLCLNCANILSCIYAKRLYGICVDGGMALMVTRCKNFVGNM